ncbi:MAG: DUF3106 domain-containing protein [Burkholderiales bacterium]|nr:DUF3106 domain-containing protein [Burkholderiales bacterium]
MRALPFSLPMLAIVATLVLVPLAAVAQLAPEPAVQKPRVTGASSSVLGAPMWSELKPSQQQSLAPLAGTWNTLSDNQRRKWIALAHNYPNLALVEQQKLHSRMAEWAALKPKDREQARWNFAETKKIAPSDLAANWEAYQALSPEVRKKLAAHAKRKPAGAAMAIMPVPTDKLAEVPKVAKSPVAKRLLIAKPESLDRHTLLPIAEPRATPKADATQD